MAEIRTVPGTKRWRAIRLWQYRASTVPVPCQYHGSTVAVLRVLFFSTSVLKQYCHSTETVLKRRLRRGSNADRRLRRFLPRFFYLTKFYIYKRENKEREKKDRKKNLGKNNTYSFCLSLRIQMNRLNNPGCIICQHGASFLDLHCLMI